MLKNRRQAQRSCSSKCHRETIRCRWILLLKSRRGFENRSKNRTAGMARRDYFYDPEAPKPNSIRPAAAVALFDSRGNILLLRRKDNDKWTMPGGTLDFGESLTDCAIREVREETGLQIRITGLIGRTDPNEQTPLGYDRALNFLRFRDEAEPFANRLMRLSSK